LKQVCKEFLAGAGDVALRASVKTLLPGGLQSAKAAWAVADVKNQVVIRLHEERSPILRNAAQF